MDIQLNKPINFSRHYILYTSFGGNGKECERDNWICGWVIYKLTGKIESELPKDDNGSNIYADNDTPMGLPFEVNAYKDSSMLLITGESIPATRASIDSPACESAVFNFTGNKFIKLIESTVGCRVDN